MTVKCFCLPNLISLLIPQAHNQTTERTPREHLQEKIDVLSIPNLRPSELAGQRTNPSQELRKLIVPMGSENLFIFPDKTYIFTTVPDIPPETISDKGTWSLDAEVLRLESDKDITWKSSHVDRRHIVCVVVATMTSFLVGMDWHLPQFERTATDDPEFTFLLLSLKREETISEKVAEPLRKKLMKEKWDPAVYR